MNVPPVPPVPYLNAITVGQTKVTGTNKPIAMLCLSTAGSSLGEYVVKLHGDTRWGTRGLAREIYGALVAAFFEISVPPIAIVNIPADLPATVQDPDKNKRVADSVGLNFGSRMVERDHYVAISSFVPDSHMDQAAHIFCFDMLVQNVDRRVEKPNLFHSPDGYTAFDHELAFSFANPSVLAEEADEPWEFAKLAAMVEGHLFYRFLKGIKGLKFDEFRAELSKLTENTIDEIESRIPAEWRDSALDVELSNIRTHIIRAKDNHRIFVQSLVEVLA